MRHLILLTPILTLAACGSHANAAGNGPQTTRNFSVGAFQSVELAGSDDVHVVSGKQASVVAFGPSAVLDRLDIHIEGGALKISRKRSGWHMGWSTSRGAVVTVTTSGIDAAALAGSGNLTVERVTRDSFKGSVAGSGELRLGEVHAAKLTLDVGGSGNISASGTASDASLFIGGSGDIVAPNLVTQTARVSVGGSGNAQLTARTSATISLAGSGNVTVKGTTNCQISKVGSGDARCLP
jgi:hypothetical protein